ncbi:hypothetical protein [Streptomyces sp. NRRL S-87]|uniref:hypothetical protein n=1 Tax=Streptomyces sp. NRRL S-87 TaxID=1463920 RepID=UPI000A7C308C|nr:hypothetical protein [Streptomyces sp. NRRL S-87]
MTGPRSPPAVVAAHLSRRLAVHAALPADRERAARQLEILARMPGALESADDVGNEDDDEAA